MKKNIFIAIWISLFFYLLSLGAYAFFKLSYEDKKFSNYVSTLKLSTQKVLLLAFLMESKLESTSLSVEKLDHKFKDDFIMKDKKADQLGRHGIIARNVIQNTESYLSSVFDSSHNVLYYRSYIEGSYIIEKETETDLNSHREEIFDIKRCKKNYSCVKSAWKKQLNDRLLVSMPFNNIENHLVINILSPVYFNELLIGEFGVEINIDNLEKNGKNLIVDTKYGNKTLKMTVRNMPFAEIAYTKIYKIDDNNLFIYEYPLIKLVIDTAVSFPIYLLIILLYINQSDKIRSHKLQAESIAKENIKDELTSLYNRKIFQSKEFIECVASRDCSIIAIDGDRIKKINDIYGHHVGDLVICSIANAMKSTFRQSDFLVRTGGDEFIAVLPECKLSKSQTLMSNLNKNLSARLANLNFAVTLSYGMTLKTPSMSLQEAINIADKKLYINKRERRN